MNDPLFTPFVLKNLTLRNRIVSTSHEPAYSVDGLPKDRYRAYHAEKARGGVALTMIGGSALVSPDSAPAFGNLQLYRDEAVPLLKALSDDVHEHGAAVMTQLTHMGHRTSNYTHDWVPALSASGTRESAHRAFTRPADALEIQRITRDFADTALRCKEGGLDGIEISAYAGHLLETFLSPARNFRTDEYGGTLENRMRFLLEVIRAVRAAVGEEFALGIRMSFDEERQTGITPQDAIAVAKAAVGVGVDFISVIKGFIDTEEDVARMIPPMDTPASPHLEFAGWVKQHIAVPVMHAAKIADVATARYAISEGLLDLVGMTRALLADPQLPNKLKAGKADQIRPCVGASMCIDGIYQSGSAYCIHNPATGRELQIPQVVPQAGQFKRAAVVGGGPAGLEAARVLAERGHAVTLFEANVSVGGQIALAAQTERRRDLIGIVDWRIGECKRLGVDIRLNSYVSAEDLIGHRFDVILVATGGVPDTGLPNAATDTWDIISGAVKAKGEVLVYDDHGGHQSLDAIDTIRKSATKIEYVTPERTVAPDVGSSIAVAYFGMLADHDVRTTVLHRLDHVERRDGRLVVTLSVDGAQASTTRIVDTLVVERGTSPDTELFDELKPHSTNLGVADVDQLVNAIPQTGVRNPEGSFALYRIGDAVSSRSIHAAILDAYRLCVAI